MKGIFNFLWYATSSIVFSRHEEKTLYLRLNCRVDSANMFVIEKARKVGKMDKYLAPKHLKKR